MIELLKWQTVTEPLLNALVLLMAEPVFHPFRLVGGTSLSLQLGHRMSIDIDLFTDSKYGSLDFNKIDAVLRANFPYVSPMQNGVVGIGCFYFIGTNDNQAIKLDLYYTDRFIEDIIDINGIRLASISEVAAMKMDIIQRIGRKKDFWDIHALLDNLSLTAMIGLHEQRYPYTHDKDQIIRNLTDFSSADEDFNPICLQGKHWEIIKFEIAEQVNMIS